MKVFLDQRVFLYIVVMKRLITLLFLFTVTISSAQVQITKIEDKPEKEERELYITKENQINLDEVKGFVLMESSNRSSVRKNFEFTPFELIYKKKDLNKFKNREGYIQIYQRTVANPPNFSATWVFRDHNNKNIFSFNTVNIGVTEALSQVGITTY